MVHFGDKNFSLVIVYSSRETFSFSMLIKSVLASTKFVLTNTLKQHYSNFTTRLTTCNAIFPSQELQLAAISP